MNVKLTNPQFEFLREISISDRAAYSIMNAQRRMADRLVESGLLIYSWSKEWKQWRFYISEPGRAALKETIK